MASTGVLPLARSAAPGSRKHVGHMTLVPPSTKPSKTVMPCFGSVASSSILRSQVTPFLALRSGGSRPFFCRCRMSQQRP
jgi:hypothetical protein